MSYGYKIKQKMHLLNMILGRINKKGNTSCFQAPNKKFKKKV